MLQRTPTTILECSKCGATAEAHCNCNAPYLPAGSRARAADAAKPGRSLREVAVDASVGKSTVQRMRKSGVPNGTPAPQPIGRPTKTIKKVIGRDGKRYPAQRKPNTKPKAVSPREAERQAINAWLGQLQKFSETFCPTLRAWREQNPQLAKDGREALFHNLHAVANQLSEIAQTFLTTEQEVSRR